MNSRPLCYSINDHSIDYLTPGHFLIGTPLLAVPERNFLDSKSSNTRWDHIKQLHQFFWKRWQSEYLNTLMLRSQWKRLSKSIKVGDIVFLTGMHSNPLTWPMRKITHTAPGSDGIVRVVTFKTSFGIYTRPVSKLVELPSDN